MLPLNSPAIDKEATVRQLAQRQPGRLGRIAVLSCVESCTTYRLRHKGRGLIEPRKEVAQAANIVTSVSYGDTSGQTRPPGSGDASSGRLLRSK